MEEENNRKDKQIEQLLDPFRVKLEGIFRTAPNSSVVFWPRTEGSGFELSKSPGTNLAGLALIQQTPKLILQFPNQECSVLCGFLCFVFLAVF